MPRQSTSKSRHFWFTAELTGHGSRSECDVKSRTNASAVPVRSSILQSVEAIFRAQGFRWDSTVDKFLFLVTMSSASSDSEMTFDSEDSEIYYIAEDTRREVGFKTMTTKLADVLAGILLTTQPPSLWLT